MVSREMLKQIYDIEFGDPQLRQLNIKLLKTVAFFGIAAWFIRNNGQLLEFPIELKRA